MENNMEHDVSSPDEKMLEDVPEILVVENDENSRGRVVSGLKDIYRITEADNGNDGLNMALEQTPDLIVTDIMMPGMSGIELCRELKTNMMTAHIPVIILTSQTAVESQLEGLGAGADFYVTKPFNMLLLKARARSLLKGRRQLYKYYTEQAEPGCSVESEILDRPEPLSRMGREFWEKMCDILEQNYSVIDFTIGTLAEDLGMRPRSLHRKIKALTDRAPLQLIAEYRLKQAAKLLRNSTIPICEVAYEVGFATPSPFYRRFKKEFGRNPSQYRKEEF